MVTVQLESIVDDLVGSSNSARKVWLFGSRRHGDACPNSDIDIVIDAAEGPGPVGGEELDRKYGGFIDVFALRDNRAISLTNGCYLEYGESASTLIEKLGAVLVWQAETGWVSEHRNTAFEVDLSEKPSRTGGPRPPRLPYRSGLLRR